MRNDDPADDRSPTVPSQPAKCVWCSGAVKTGRRLSIGEDGKEFWIHDTCLMPYRAMMQGGG